MNEGNFPDNMGKHCPYCQQNIKDSLFDEHLHKHKEENDEINNNRPPLSKDNDQPPKISPSQVPIAPNPPKIPNIIPPMPIINNNNYFFPPPIVYPPYYFSQNNNNEAQINDNINNNNNQFVPNRPPLYPYFRYGNSGPGHPYAYRPFPQPMPYYFPPPKIVHGLSPEIIEKFKKGYLSKILEEIDEIMNYLPTRTLTEKMVGVQKDCIICLNDYEIGDTISTLPCFHMYHSSCVKDWFKSKDFCPVCKYKISIKKLREENENYIKD